MTPDPVEETIAEALDACGIRYVREPRDVELDFWLPELGTYIECKQFHSERSSQQLARADNVILVQGMAAASALAFLIRGLWREPQ